MLDARAAELLTNEGWTLEETEPLMDGVWDEGARRVDRFVAPS